MLSITGIVLFNIILLIFIIALIIFTPSVHRRYSVWKLNSLTKRRERFMHKHNLILKPSLLPDDADRPRSPLCASRVDQQQLSPSALLHTLEPYQRVPLQYQTTEQTDRKSDISPARPSIF